MSKNEVKKKVSEAEAKGREMYESLIRTLYPSTRIRETDGQYDLCDMTMTGATGQKYAVELKYREVDSSTYPDVMFNIEKRDSLLSKCIPDYGTGICLYGDNKDYRKVFVNCWKDGTVAVFKVETEPKCIREKEIAITTVDQSQGKKMQKRIFYDLSQASAIYRKDNNNWNRLK